MTRFSPQHPYCSSQPLVIPVLKGSSALFWPPLALHVFGVHYIHECKILICKKERGREREKERERKRERGERRGEEGRREGGKEGRKEGRREGRKEGQIDRGNHRTWSYTGQ